MLYELAGDSRMSEQLNLLLKSGLPQEIVEALKGEISPNASKELYSRRYNSYKTDILPPAIVLKNIESADNILTKVSSITGGIKLIDIITTRYGIYSFNDSPSHITSYFRNREDYVCSTENMFAAIIEFKYKGSTYKLGLIFSAYHSRMNNETISGRRAWATTRFPAKILSRFDDRRILGEKLVIEEFIKFCRGKVRK